MGYWLSYRVTGYHYNHNWFKRLDWAGSRRVESGKVFLTFSNISQVFEDRFDFKGIDRQYVYDFTIEGRHVSVRMVFFYPYVPLRPCEIISASQELSGYWIVSKHMLDRLKLPIWSDQRLYQARCFEGGTSGDFWFLRDIIGLITERNPMTRCYSCGGRARRSHLKSFAVFYSQGREMLATECFCHKNVVCEPKALKEQSASYSRSQRRINKYKKDKKCLNELKQKLSAAKRLIRDRLKNRQPQEA